MESHLQRTARLLRPQNCDLVNVSLSVYSVLPETTVVSGKAHLNTGTCSVLESLT